MEHENLLDSIICKEQNEIIKINEKTNEMKKKNNGIERRIRTHYRPGCQIQKEW